MTNLKYLSERDQQILDMKITSDRKNFIEVFLIETPGVADYNQESGWQELSTWIQRIKSNNRQHFKNDLFWGDVFKNTFRVFWSEQNNIPVVAVAGYVKTLEFGNNQIRVFEEKFLSKKPGSSKTLSAKEMYTKILQISDDIGVLKVYSDDSISKDNFERVWEKLSKDHDVFVYDTGTSKLTKIDDNNPASNYWGVGKENFKFLLTDDHSPVIECIFEIRRARLLIGNN